MNVYSRSSKISTQFTLNIRKMWTFQVLSEYFKLWVALGLPPRFPLPGFLCLSVCRVFWTVRVTVSTKTKRYSRILVQNQTSNVHKHRMWSVKAEKSTCTVTRMSANLAFSHRFSCWKLFSTWSKVTKTRFLSYKSHYFLKSTPLWTFGQFTKLWTGCIILKCDIRRFGLWKLRFACAGTPVG